LGIQISKGNNNIKSFIRYTELAILLLITLSCTKETDNETLSLNERLNFSLSVYTTIFKNQLTSDGYIFNQDSIIQYYDTLKHFYSGKDYQPLFVQSFEDNEKVYALISIFEKCTEHGLNSEQYHFTDIINEFSQATDTIPNESRYYHLALTELLISDAILKYSHHLRYGMINPKEIFSDSYFLPYDDSSKGDLLEPLRQEDVIAYLNKIQPNCERYVKLQDALKYYSKFVGQEWPQINISVNKIEIGSQDPAIPEITERLITLGYIDTVKVKISNPLLYDSLKFKYVQQFQRDNGLNDDGVIGKNTIERFNFSPEQYVNTIKLNLERFRWNVYPDTSQYILVNIPDFRLFIVDKQEIVFNTKVCVGSKRPSNFQERMKVYKRTRRWSDKPDDWETPNMYGEISYLVLNPTWNVPQSIMREEIVYKMKKDSSYLSSHNFKVYLDTLELNPDSIKISDLSVEKIPYKIIQDPGAGNALGKIKFIFNNPFGIYLHDTPTRPPFKNSNRAVSHGCIRVEQPLPLAEFLLRNHPKWNIDFLKIEIGQKVENKAFRDEYARKRESLRKYASLGVTTDVNLSKKIPLYIDYFTVWVDDSGVIQFRADVYNRDKVLLEFLTTKQLI
jgi:murein L,D-transpeptidase YcbB/YkuD